MKVIENIKIAGRNLKKRKCRTCLTSLGITIGIASILIIISLSTGLQDINKEALSKIGDIKSIIVRPVLASSKVDLTKNSVGLKEKDLDFLSHLSGVIDVLPNIRLAGNARLRFSCYESNSSVFGYLKDKEVEYGFDILRGRLPERNNEILISEEVNKFFEFTQSREQLEYSEKDTITLPSSFNFIGRQVVLTQEESVQLKEGGAKQRENAQTFTVVGILKENSNIMNTGFGLGPKVYMMSDRVEELNNWYSQLVTKKKYGEKIYDSVNVKVIDEKDIDRVSNEIKTMGYQIFSLSIIIQQVNNMFSVFKVILVSIAAIALVVATINIINIMYMSIIERNKEIGVMKVLGASISAIRQMFLYEAVLIGFIGGLIGIILGEIFTYVIGYFLVNNIYCIGDSIAFPFKFDLILISGLLIISIVIGIIAGILPANKAARISPLEAIRNE